MAITEGTLLQMTVAGFMYSQQVMNVYTYEVAGTFSGITAGAVANAWWNHVKTPYRALASTVFGVAFDKVIVRDMGDPLGEYGEYAIPTAERTGSRDTGATNGMPGFVAAGVRLGVGTRVTRPGQKRIAWLTETDSAGTALDAGFASLVNTLMAAAISNITLGSPAVGMALHPVVVRVDPTTRLPVAHQPITGYAVNTFTTSQVSRKVGKGS